MAGSCPLIDHRLLHLDADQQMQWLAGPGGPPGTCGAVLSVVDLLDFPRCPQRALRMHQAHALVQQAAGREEELTMALLVEWHAAACPGGRMRNEPWAYAKGGDERYSLDNDLLDQRLRALDKQPPLARCLRAYLDILFFQPFTDGNSRVARLTFHFLASRNGLSFRTACPLFRLSLPAGHLGAYTLFQQLAHRCVLLPEL